MEVCEKEAGRRERCVEKRLRRTWGGAAAAAVVVVGFA